MTKPAVADVVVLCLSALAGLAIGYVDSRPTWDDTGITVGALLLSAGVLALFRPRYWWLSGLIVGAPVPIFNYIGSGNLGSAVAMAFALAAAGLGALVGKALGIGPDAHPHGAAR